MLVTGGATASFASLLAFLELEIYDMPKSEMLHSRPHHGTRQVHK